MKIDIENPKDARKRILTLIFVIMILGMCLGCTMTSCLTTNSFERECTHEFTTTNDYYCFEYKNNQ